MKTKSTAWLAGLAMFKMFFGAGNIVFSLAIGQFANSQNIWALLGLLITAVFVPFTGVVAIALYKGDTRAFFARAGEWPGFCIALVILALIGPFGAIPRCLTLSHSTMQMLFPNLPLWLFCTLACGFILFCTIKKNRLMQILGYVFAPALIGLVAIIIVKGFWHAPEMLPSDMSGSVAFTHGLLEGYNTLDLLPAFFFSSIVVSLLQKNHPEYFDGEGGEKRILKLMLKASCIGAFLIGAIYVGFSFLAAHYQETLVGLRPETLFSRLAWTILGPWGGAFTCISVLVSCVATSIALTAVFGDFVHKEVFKQRYDYRIWLVITVAIAFAFCFLGFSGIVKMIAPILLFCYPALLMLTLLNICHKIFNLSRGAKIAMPVTFLGTWLLQNPTLPGKILKFFAR